MKMKNTIVILMLICVMLVSGCESDTELIKLAQEAYYNEHLLTIALMATNKDLEETLKDSVANTDKVMDSLTELMITMETATDTIVELMVTEGQSAVTIMDLTNKIEILEKEPDAVPVWGKGDLPADFVENFGNSNLARLSFAQSEMINRHEMAINELSKQLNEIKTPQEVADPNGGAK